MLNPFKKTAVTRLLFFITTDILSIIVAVLFSFLIRFDSQIPPQYAPFIVPMIILIVLFVIPIFYFQRLYSFSWSYVSINEIISLFTATTLAFVFLGVTIYISKYFPEFNNFPRSTIFISYVLVFGFCAATRLAKKIYVRLLGGSNMTHHEKTLIVGAGDAGEQIARNILSARMKSYSVIGFLDDNPMKKGVKIHGIKVLGKISDLPGIVEKNDIKQVIIALPSASNKVITGAVELARSSGIRKIKITPPLNEIIRGEVSLKNLKDVDVEDLLGRDSIELDTKQIESFIQGHVVLITGAAGSIGSELSRQVAKFKPSVLVLLDQDETGIFNISGELKTREPHTKLESCIADITDREAIGSIMKEFHPTIVFHAAAYKHVPLMEDNAGEAVKNNIFGSEVLANVSLENNVEKFIFISTDKAVNPTSVMGATKRVGEMICQTYNQKGKTKFISVRFGNVLNSRGSVIPIFREQIRRGGPVQVTHPDMQRYFMLTSEACLLVMEAGAMGKGGEVFVLDMGKPINILNLAKEMIRLSGFKPDKDIAIVFTGTRPGEKLFEEILTAEEGVIATQNQKIFMAKMSDVNPVDFQSNLLKLRTVTQTGKKDEIITLLKAMTPYYV